MKEHVQPDVIRKDVQRYRITHLLEWWGQKPVTSVKRSTCRDYIEWRIRKERVVEKKNGQRIVTTVEVSTARKDLETLNAAIRLYHAEYALDVLPIVTLPPKSPPREEWLTRDQIAALLRAARQRKMSHLVRFILIGVYTGTRTTAILNLQWLPSTEGGWFDVDRGVLYRRGRNAVETQKRQPPARIHERLLPYLRRWQKADIKQGIRHVVHYRGEPIEKLRRSWDAVRDIAKRTAQIDFHFTRHTLRHTAATWQMQAGTPSWEAAGYLGMSAETLERVYGHHSPAFQTQAAKAVAPKNAPPKRPRYNQTEDEQTGTHARNTRENS